MFRHNSSYATVLLLAHRAVAVRQNDHCCLRSKWSRNNISFFLKFWDWIWNPIHALACSGIRCIVHNFLFYQFKYPCAGFRYQTATAPFKMAQVLASFKFRLQLVELEVRAERLKCDAMRFLLQPASFFATRQTIVETANARLCALCRQNQRAKDSGENG